MSDPLSFPPLLRGEALEGSGPGPFEKAVSAAMLGTDPGLIPYRLGRDVLEAAVVLAPEAPLEEAMAMVFAAKLGFGDALGALAPPEVAVQFDWPGGVRVNGARCGAFRAAASTRDPGEEPDWLVIGFALPLWSAGEGGEAPGETVLYAEGCADVDPRRLVESWSRHMLVWINRWEEAGMAPLHSDWRGRAFAMGEDVEALGKAGVFVGLDEQGGMLLRRGEETGLMPLSEMLEG